MSTETVSRRSRPKIPYDVQVEVFFRDGWLCWYCHKPTVFGYALKYMEEFVIEQGFPRQLAYYSFYCRRDKSPLLDHLVAVIDHVEPFAKGGDHGIENFVTACNKCNMRKATQSAERISKGGFGKPVRGRYGEPKYWDGLASMFLVLARKHEGRLKGAEREWYIALTKFINEEADEARLDEHAS